MRESRRGIVDRIEGNLAVCEILSEREGESAVLREIPLDDEAVYTALGEAYRNGDMEMPVAAACELLGSSVNQFDTELFRAAGFTEVRSLIRFMSLGHGSGLWQDNQQSLLQSGEICPAQLIT